MILGKIKHYNEKKRYGFISRNDGGIDCFFHISEIWEGGINPPKEGAAVFFEVKQSNKGPRAINVKLCEGYHEKTKNEEG